MDATEPAPEHLGRRAARGAAVTLLGQGTRVLVQVVSVIVLARLLTPHDYGLFTLVLVIIGVGEIFRDFGLSTAAIQARELSRVQRDNLLWMNAAIGLALSLLVFAAAPLLAATFHQEELTGLARVAAWTFLLNGFATQYRASLNRSLRFGSVVVADLTGPVAGLVVAVVCALHGLGYWSLVIQQLVQASTILVVVALLSGWLPRAYRRGAGMGHFVHFGWNLVATQLVNYAGNNTDSVVLGLTVGPSDLGLYSRAFSLLKTPLNQVLTPVTNVAIPILARLQDAQDRFSEYVVRGQLLLGYTAIAGLGVVVSCSRPIVDLAFGPEWAGLAPLLALIAVAASFQTLTFVANWVYVSRALTGSLFRFTVVSVLIKITCILVGSRWGVVGVAAGYAASPVLAWPLAFLWLSRLTTIPTRRLLLGGVRISAVVYTTAALAWWSVSSAEQSGSVAQLAVGVGVTLLGYLAWAALVPAVRRDVAAVLHTARLVRSPRRPAAAV